MIQLLRLVKNKNKIHQFKRPKQNQKEQCETLKLSATRFALESDSLEKFAASILLITTSPVAKGTFLQEVTNRSSPFPDAKNLLCRFKSAAATANFLHEERGRTWKTITWRLSSRERRRGFSSDPLSTRGSVFIATRCISRLVSHSIDRQNGPFTISVVRTQPPRSASDEEYRYSQSPEEVMFVEMFSFARENSIQIAAFFEKSHLNKNCYFLKLLF